RPRTPAFHVGNTGSNPVGDANENKDFSEEMVRRNKSGAKWVPSFDQNQDIDSTGSRFSMILLSASDKRRLDKGDRARGLWARAGCRRQAQGQSRLLRR